MMRRRDRRDFLAQLGLGALASAFLSDEGHAVSTAGSLKYSYRVRTITVGVTLARVDDLATIDAALALLARARTRFTEAGYEVQTTRVTMQALLAGVDAGARARALPALEALDRAVAARESVASIGPLLTEDRHVPELPAWCAELVQRTGSISFSVSVASPSLGVHARSCATAGDVIAALSEALPGGVANFRFAAAANIPAGTPFFPVGYHEGATALAIGLESPDIVRVAMSAGDPRDAEQRLREALNRELAPVARVAGQIATDEGVRYLGIDSSPAPGLDASIGAAIEAFTHQPFGSASTLAACAVITAALKSLSVATCGYSGLMLPVLEDPVLAARAREGRYGIEELLLYSAVCGTGLDVVPIPGATPPAAIARVVGDVAALSAKLRKPLSARLFPSPGRKAGDLVRFDNPHLTETAVFDVV